LVFDLIEFHIALINLASTPGRRQIPILAHQV
jgi:hypothetical protein